MELSENPKSRFLLVALLVAILVGCASPPSENVFVDIDRVIAEEPAPELGTVSLPRPKAAVPPLVVKQPGLPSTRTLDRTLARLEAAKRLISENRSKSIASLSTMLKRIYLAQAEDEIAKRDKDVQPADDSIIGAAYERVHQIFDTYGQDRGPLIAQLNTLVGNINLADQAVPDHADAVAKVNIPKANQVRAQIRQLDKRYDAEAAQILADAQIAIDTQIAALKQQADRTRSTAEAKAVREAESQATLTQVALDVQVKQLVPGTLPSEPPRQVTVPGTKPMSPAPIDNAKPIFGSLEERRHLLDQEIDIWIRTAGLKRSVTPKGGRHATEEFLLWRSAHKVGP